MPYMDPVGITPHCFFVRQKKNTKALVAVLVACREDLRLPWPSSLVPPAMCCSTQWEGCPVGKSKPSKALKMNRFLNGFWVSQKLGDLLFMEGWYVWLHDSTSKLRVLFTQDDYRGNIPLWRDIKVSDPQVPKNDRQSHPGDERSMRDRPQVFLNDWSFVKMSGLLRFWEVIFVCQDLKWFCLEQT